MSELQLGEGIEEVVMEALQDGMVFELETIELDKNDGVELPAPHPEDYYDYPKNPPLPRYPAVIVLADSASSDEEPDSDGRWKVEQRVFITVVCSDQNQQILHKKVKRYLLAFFKALLNSERLGEAGYGLIAPWNVEYMPQKFEKPVFTEDGTLEITIDSLEG